MTVTVKPTSLIIGFFVTGITFLVLMFGKLYAQANYPIAMSEYYSVPSTGSNSDIVVITK
jgi:hypothetical protein